MSKSVRIDDDLHEWIMKSFAKSNTVSDVIRDLKLCWEQQQQKMMDSVREMQHKN